MSKLAARQFYGIKYSKRINYLMPSPYQTNCFDYNKIGYKSRSDCIDKCNIESSLKQCKSLPYKVNVNRHNDKDHYNGTCSFNYSICEEKYKSPDCINEIYLFKTFFDLKVDESPKIKGYKTSSLLKMSSNQSQKNKSISWVMIAYGDEEDTVYRHSPQQEPVEFICFICGVISLWTGFSIFSIYSFGRRVLIANKRSIKFDTIIKTF